MTGGQGRAAIFIAHGTVSDYAPATMTEPDENPRRYRWPWLVLAAVVLAIVLAVLWVAAAARKVAQQRDYNSPLPVSAPAR